MKAKAKSLVSLLLSLLMIVGLFAAAAAVSADEPTIVTNDDIIIRDPFILTDNGRYYLYGTEGTAPFSGAMDKFLVYTGTDLEHWEGPYVAFKNDGTFWADQRYWAPSIVKIDGKYYLYGTMGGSSKTAVGGGMYNGIQTFVADDPLGPFVPTSEYPFTSESYECIDPEVYAEDGKYYMVYSHKGDGDKDGFYAAELNEDHTAFKYDDSQHIFLFNDNVGDVPWAVTSMTDGAALLKTESGQLVCFFSTRDGDGVTYYNMGYAVSDNGRLDGNWTIADKKMLSDGESGGHNMIFTNLDGKTMTAYHSPNVALPAFGGNPTFKYVTESSDGEIFFTDSADAKIWKNEEIFIRDPFVVTYEGKYYMYGTEGSAPFGGKMNRFEAYVSDDLKYWEGPYVIFQNDGSYWANQRYWAPAMYVKDNKFYFYGALGGRDSEGNSKSGITLLTSDNPLGPFEAAEEPMFAGIDAEIYEEDGKTYMLYSNGDFYAVELNETLDGAAGEPFKLFDVTSCPWAVGTLNDGAAILRTDDGRLVCFFSTRDGSANQNYNMGYAVSDNGKITGKWIVSDVKLLADGLSGGHNMVFTDKNGDIMTVYHAPNLAPSRMSGNPTFKYINYKADGEIYFSDAKSVATDKTSYMVNETITVTVETNPDVTNVGFMNENGKWLGKNLVSKTEADGKITWVYNIKIGTKGDRDISVCTYTDFAGFALADTIEVKINSGDIAENIEADIISAQLDGSATVARNESFTVTVTTNKGVSKIGFNNGVSMIGKTLVSKEIVDDTIVWTYALSLGSKGNRTITVMAADSSAAWIENTKTINIKVA